MPGRGGEDIRGAQRLAEALLGDLERIAERSVARMQAFLPSYAKVAAEKLIPVTSINTRNLLEAVRNPDADTTRAEDHFRVWAETRLSQGIAADEMLHAWRIGLEVVREEAHPVAGQLGLSDSALLEFVEATMRWGGTLFDAACAEVSRLAQEQAALRRVATLVAQDVARDELFAAVAEEVGTLLGFDYTALIRYEPDPAYVTTSATWAATGEPPPVPARFRTVSGDPIASVEDTGQPARIDDWSNVPGPAAEFVRRELGVHASVASPIVVNGALWGALTVHSKRGPLPLDTEPRLMSFTELVVTALANATARDEASRLAEEQAALRRVATLVAQDTSPTAVFDAVAAEMQRLLAADAVTIGRYEAGEEMTVVAHRSPERSLLTVGTRVNHEGRNVTAMVRQMGQPARLNDLSQAHRGFAELFRDLGMRQAVGAPIVVDGRLWGTILGSWNREEPPPPETEDRMLQFAELLDTAIANAHSRDELTASRARLVTETDNARRRVVRDLHDGAQQRLLQTIVTLKLAQRALTSDSDKAGALVAEALAHAQQGNTELRELAHGILPAVLAQGGLRSAIRSIVSRLEIPVEVDVPGERFQPEVEASAYFVVAEALTNVVKHSRAGRAGVRAFVADGILRLEVRDDGVGGADANGHGLVGLGDRVTAIGGHLMVTSPEGGGTLLTAELPVHAS